jgi:hypothetical protein
MDKKLIILTSSPFLAAALSFIIISSFVKFKTTITPLEQKLLKTSHDKVQIIERQPFTVDVLNSPVEIPVPLKKDYPPIPLSKMAPPKIEEPQAEIKVSFILINNSRKMAIINGIVVKEGDLINKSKVERIEKNRVLIKDERGRRWIRIE